MRASRRVGLSRRAGLRGFGNAVVSPPVSNAVAFWPMDSSLGTIRDYAGRGNDLTRDMAPAVSGLAFQVGGNSGDGTQQVTGRMAKWGVWKRLLTSAEKTAIAGGEGWPFSTTPSLRDCTAYYLLDEASASSTFADATGRGNTLTKAGPSSTTRVAGPLGTDFAVRLSGGVVVLASSPVTADLQTGNVTHTVAGWVNLDALGTAQQVFWGQFDGGNRLGDAHYYHFANGRFQLDCGNDVDLYRNAVIVDSVFGAPTTGVWYHLLSEYDPVANALRHSVNNGTPSTLSAIQQPAPVNAGSRTALQLRVNPDFRTLNTSGWDLVGKYVSASRAINADLSIGNNAKSAWGWLKLADTTTTQVVAGAFDSTTNALDWVIQQSAGRLYFLLGDSIGGFDFCSVALANTSWHSFIAWYDKAGDGKMHLVLDNNAVIATPTTLTHTPATGSLPFILGNSSAGASRAQQLKATVTCCGMSTGAPSNADIAALYAAGTGLT